MIRICFVCLGNICRSPMAEGVFKHLADEAGLGDRFHIESAALGPWHVGELADSRARQTAAAHGVRLDGTAQQVKPKDFARFDLLIAMDDENVTALRRLAPAERDRQKIRLLREFDPEANGDTSIPDPYYGTRRDFEEVYQMVERSSRGLLEEIKRQGLEVGD